MNLVTTTLKNSIQVIIRFIVGILNIKVIAVLLGPAAPAGMALLGQLNNALQIGVSLSTLGFKDGIVKYVSQYKGNKAEQNKFISTSYIAVFFAAVFFSLICIFFSRFLSNYILKSEDYFLIFRFAGIFLITNSLLNLTISVLNGLEQQKYFILINIILSVTGFGLALGAVWLWGLNGLLWAQIFISIFAFISGIIIFKKIIKTPIKTVSSDVLKKLSKYSAMALFSAIAVPLINIVIRNIIINNASLTTAGLWEGINKISSNYLLIITSAFGYYFIPTFSQMQKKQQVVDEIKKSYKLLVPLLLAGAVAIFFAKDLIIKLIFTKEFIHMRPLFIWQVIGDFFKILAWILATLLIAKARIKTYLTIEICFLALQVVLVKTIITQLGNNYITLYYAIENFLYFTTLTVIFYYYYFKGRHGNEQI